MREFRPMSISHIMDKALNIHRKHIWTSFLYLLLMSLTAVPAIFIVAFVSIFIFSMSAVGRMNTMMYAPNDATFYILFGFMALFILLFSAIFQMIPISGLIKIGSQGFLNNRISAGNAYGTAFKNIPRMLSVVIAGIIISLPVIGFIGISIFIVSTTYDGSVFGIILAIVLGLISFAGIVYVTIIHIFSLHTVTLEKLYFFKALKRSRELVKGKFWYILGCSTLFSLSTSAISYSIYALFGLIGGIFYIILELLNIGEEVIAMLAMNLNLIRGPLQFGVSFLVLPIGAYFMTILYYNQRFKREGFDIRLEVAKLKKNLNKQ